MAQFSASKTPVFKTARRSHARRNASRRGPMSAENRALDLVENSVPFPQVASGFVELFRHVDPDDFMWSGSGTREIRKEMTYDRFWSATPFVLVNLVALDASKSHNLRFELSVDSSTVSGFEIVFRTWSDTMIASASVQWTAIGISAEDRLRSILSK